MFLSQLKIIGFKSFALKTEIHFKEGLTAIIGPNGCGKSNIVDAIRWVLGEQKYSALRSSKMEDVIFNGTIKYPAKNVAEVTIIIENNKNILPMEYNEVSITRRLYRSGESEYLINGNKCRLKDIINLFLDTGMGSHAYSIIEQQMIHALLSDKRDDRKNIFDEAAGIMKYKDRKKEALQKLNANDSDLARVNDLILEIEKNVRSLKRQAAKANKYLSLEEEKKEKEIFFYHYKLKEIEKFILPLRKELENISKEKIEIITCIHNKEAEIQKLIKDSIDKNHEFQKIQKKCQENNRKKHEIKEELTIIEERKKNDQSQLSAIEEENRELKEKEKKIKNEIFNKKNELDIIKKEFNGIQIKFEEIVQQLGMREKQLNELKKSRDNSLEYINQLKNDIQQIIQEMNTLKNQKQWLENEKINLVLQNNEFKKTYENNEIEINKLKTLKNQILLKMEENDEDMLRYEYQVNEILDKKQDLLLHKENIDRELNRIKDKYDIINSISIEDSLDSEDEKKWVNQIKSEKIDMIDIFHYINPKKDSYHKIVWILMKYLNARFYLDCPLNDVGVVHQHPFGMVKFFNSVFTNTGMKTKLEQDYYTPFSDLLEISIEYEKEIRELFSSCYYCNNCLEIDFDEIREYPVIIIDSNGLIMDLRNKMFQTGQEKKQNSDLTVLFGKEAKLKKLKEELTKNQDKGNNINGELIQIENKLNSAKKNYQVIKEKKDFNQKELSELSSKIERKKMEIENELKNSNQIKEKISKIEQQKEKLEKNLIEKKNLYEELNEKEIKNEEIYQQKEKEFQEYYQSISHYQEEKNKNQLDLVEKKGKVEIVETELQQQQVLLKDIINRTQKNEQSASERTKSLEMYKNDIEKKNHELKKISIQLDQEYKIRDEIDREIEFFNNQRDEYEKELKNIRKKGDNTQLIIDETKEKLFLYEKNYEIYKDKLMEKYHLDYNADYDFNKGYSIDNLEQEISSLSNQLSILGNVNFEAIDEYDEQKKRFDFYIQQRDDLEKSKELLLSTIKEINKTAEELYLSTFSSVRENFKKIFINLFEGGDCDLVLDKNPDDPLDMDVSILARPKGKKIQHITLLSGGEKALTSIALLFAIYLVKPSPYCILDELDAPLDDANVRRFLKLLRDFTDETQFILITHNKNTMSASDVLYGVTMEEAGISKLVSVNISSQGVEL